MTLTIGDVSWDAMFPEDCTIKIEQAGTNTSNTITTRVTNFEDGGGAIDTESIPHFGGAFLTVTKPQEEFEVSFDVSMKDTIWAQIISDSVTAAGSATVGSTIEAKSGGDKKKYKIKLEWRDANGSDAYKVIYYNAYGVSYEKSSAADDRLVTTVSFNLAPTSAVGSGQKYEIETSGLYNTEMGSQAGSYDQFEETADTLFSFGVGSMLY